MVVVTWRHVSRVARHVPPRKKYAKKVSHPYSPNGGGREPKLSGQKGLGLT